MLCANYVPPYKIFRVSNRNKNSNHHLKLNHDSAFCLFLYTAVRLLVRWRSAYLQPRQRRAPSCGLFCLHVFVKLGHHKGHLP